jgi:hypothetical protein
MSVEEKAARLEAYWPAYIESPHAACPLTPPKWKALA